MVTTLSPVLGPIYNVTLTPLPIVKQGSLLCFPSPIPRADLWLTCNICNILCRIWCKGCAVTFKARLIREGTVAFAMLIGTLALEPERSPRSPEAQTGPCRDCSETLSQQKVHKLPHWLPPTPALCHWGTPSQTHRAHPQKPCAC